MKYLINLAMVMGGIVGLGVLGLLAERIFGQKGLNAMVFLVVVILPLLAFISQFWWPFPHDLIEDMRYYKR